MMLESNCEWGGWGGGQVTDRYAFDKRKEKTQGEQGSW